MMRALPQASNRRRSLDRVARAKSPLSLLAPGRDLSFDRTQAILEVVTLAKEMVG